MSNINSSKTIEWVLRIAVAGEFIGHGVLALGGKTSWVGWIEKLSGVSESTAVILLLLIGVMDVLLGLIVLFRPIRPLILWMAFWGFFTAILRPIVGESFWDFIERFANFGAPLALFLLIARKKTNE